MRRGSRRRDVKPDSSSVKVRSVMDTLGCAICKSEAYNRAATADEVKAFWNAKGVDGAAPEGSLAA